MFDFSEYSLEEAQEYCRAFIRAIPERLEWLSAEVRSTNGLIEVYESGYDGLEYLWKWMVEQIEISGKTSPLGRPHWHSNNANPYIDDRMLWVIDAVGIYLGELVREVVPGANWDVYHVTSKFNDINQHRTMLHGLPSGPADPIRMVYGEVIGKVIHNEPYKMNALRALYNYMVNPSGAL